MQNRVNYFLLLPVFIALIRIMESCSTYSSNSIPGTEELCDLIRHETEAEVYISEQQHIDSLNVANYLLDKGHETGKFEIDTVNYIRKHFVDTKVYHSIVEYRAIQNYLNDSLSEISPEFINTNFMSYKEVGLLFSYRYRLKDCDSSLYQVWKLKSAGQLETKFFIVPNKY